MNKTELKENIWKLIDEKQDDLIKLSSDMIKIPSINPPFNPREINGFIKNYFTKTNIKYDEVGPDDEYISLVSQIGEGEKVLLFNGHSDVVPTGEVSKWDFDPFSGEVVDGKMLGRGTSDMKCGLSGVMFAMNLIQESGIELNGQARLHVVPDEETGGYFGSKWLCENGYVDDVDCCIIAEPTSRVDCEVGQKGSLALTVKSFGIPAHGSLGKYVGRNAIRNIMDFLIKFDDLSEMTGNFTDREKEVLAVSKAVALDTFGVPGVENILDHVTVNLGTIKGGTKSNMVADYCECEVDIRVPIGLTVKEVLDKIDGFIKEGNFEGIEYEYSYKGESNSVDPDTEIVKLCTENASTVWNNETVGRYQWASSDARYYRMANVPTIQYGPANTGGIHSYNEDVDVIDIINCAKVYAGVIIDYLA